MPDAFAAHVRTLALRLPLADLRRRARRRSSSCFIFQTLLGAWPISEERLDAYLEKAMREAKVHTSWVEPDEAHEAAVKAFARALLTHREFLRDFEPFQREVAAAGDRAALGQLLLKLTVPGVPDIYQGDELLCLSLVDPDNRRPVDWEERRAALADPPPKLRPDPCARSRCARAAPRPSRAPTSRSTRARTLSPSCAAARCSSRARLRGDAGARAAGGRLARRARRARAHARRLRA